MRCSRKPGRNWTMATWRSWPRKSPNINGIRIRWSKRLQRRSEKVEHSNRSSRHRGEVAGGGKRHLREAGPQRLAGRNGGAGTGTTGDGAARREPTGTARGDVRKFDDCEIHREARGRPAPRVPESARPSGGGCAAESGWRAPGVGRDQDWRRRSPIRVCPPVEHRRSAFGTGSGIEGKTWTRISRIITDQTEQCFFLLPTLPAGRAALYSRARVNASLKTFKSSRWRDSRGVPFRRNWCRRLPRCWPTIS